jgi:hypothetical protein
VTEHNVNLVRESVYQTLGQGSHPGAVWSLKVTVFHQHHARLGIALAPVP